MNYNNTNTNTLLNEKQTATRHSEVSIDPIRQSNIIIKFKIYNTT